MYNQVLGLPKNGTQYYAFYTTLDKGKPTISSVSAVLVTDTKAAIQWVTDEQAISSLSYGTTSGDLTSTVQSSEELNNHHVTFLSDLTPDTTYYYTVTSTDDSGNVVTSTESTFQTLASDTNLQTLDELNDQMLELINEQEGITPEEIETNINELIQGVSEIIPSPLIQGEPGVDEKSTTATITWTTDKEANSIVAYNPEELYSTEISNPYQYKVGDIEIFRLEHSVTLLDLTPETTYHYQVKSKGRISGESTSADYTFTTERKSFGIENYSVEKLTNEESNIQLGYYRES